MAASAERSRRWLTEHALPLWAEVGYDADRGGFFERLNLDGRPDVNARRRMRVQARQIYAFSHAAALGWFPAGRDIATRAMDVFVETCWAPDREPGWVHVLEPNGSVYDARRDTYDHAFALLALGWFHRATGESRALELIDQTLAYLDERLASPAHGGYVECTSGQAYARRQNPHMHLFEAFLALYQTVGDSSHLARAGEMFSLFTTHFFDEKRGVVREFFTADWRPASSGLGDVVEPGHHAEWSYLLGVYGRLADRPVDWLTQPLLSHALEFGSDKSTGFLYDQVSIDGRILSPTRRCWPQTELIRALVSEYHAGRCDEGQISARVDALMRTYLHYDPRGAWMDKFDADGRPICDHIPAATLYHIMGAIVAVDQALTKAAIPTRTRSIA